MTYMKLTGVKKADDTEIKDEKLDQEIMISASNATLKYDGQNKDGASTFTYTDKLG